MDSSTPPELDPFHHACPELGARVPPACRPLSRFDESWANRRGGFRAPLPQTGHGVPRVSMAHTPVNAFDTSTPLGQDLAWRPRLEFDDVLLGPEFAGFLQEMGILFVVDAAGAQHLNPTVVRALRSSIGQGVLTDPVDASRVVRLVELSSARNTTDFYCCLLCSRTADGVPVSHFRAILCSNAREHAAKHHNVPPGAGVRYHPPGVICPLSPACSNGSAYGSRFCALETEYRSWVRVQFVCRAVCGEAPAERPGG
jgi:hypothetical protein